MSWTKIIALCNAIFLAPAYAGKIECKTSIKGAVSIDIEASTILLPDRKDCDFDTSVEKNIDGSGGIGIMIGPSKESLGVNAHYSIYIRKKAEEKFLFAGDLPVGAQRAQNGRFKYARQEGGGIYLTTYRIKSGAVAIEFPEKSLLIDATYCVTRHLITESIFLESECTGNTISASFKNPLCVVTTPNSQTLVRRKQCADVMLDIDRAR